MECITAPANLPSTHLHRLFFAFSCGRRGTASRWMRSAPSLPPTSRLRIDFLFLLCRGRRPRRPARPLFRRPLVFISTFAFCSVGLVSPDDPQRYYFRLPTVSNLDLCFSPAFSCGRRGTASRWMRSNALPYSKTSPEGKTPHPSAFGCHLLPPEKAYLHLRFPPVGVGAPDDPHALFLADLSSSYRLLLPTRRGRRPDDPQRLLSRHPPQHTDALFPLSATKKSTARRHRAVLLESNRLSSGQCFFSLNIRSAV